jgi:recombination protein RecR
MSSKYYAKPLNDLIRALSGLPGIGGKSAQRLAFYILSMNDVDANAIADAIIEAKRLMKYCSVCGNLTDADPCGLCEDKSRDRSVICVVENPRDVAAIERTGEFRGFYHVLHGVISPMDGIGPDDINLRQLLIRLQNNDDARKSYLRPIRP